MVAPIQEIRALLLQFQRSTLTDIYYRSTDWTVFMARPGGGANPVLGSSGDRSAAGLSCAPGIAAAAPHLGLFEPLRAPGDMVEAGAVIAVIDVLGRKTDVASPAHGRIGALCVGPGALVEYGEVLLEIEPA